MMKKYIFFQFALLTILGISSMSFAQTDSTATTAPPVQDPPPSIDYTETTDLSSVFSASTGNKGFKYKITADGNISKGNVDRTLLIFRTDFSYANKAIDVSTHPRFTYGKQNGILAERDFFTDLNISLYDQNPVYGFGIGIIETSNLRAIKLRTLGGLGIGFRIVRAKNHKFSITNAIMYESTTFLPDTTIKTLRNSVRLKGDHYFFSKKIKITHISFIQPSLLDINNIRASTMITLEIPLNRLISIRSSFEDSYESVVQKGRKRNDSRWTFGVAIGNF